MTNMEEKHNGLKEVVFICKDCIICTVLPFFRERDVDSFYFFLILSPKAIRYLSMDIPIPPYTRKSLDASGHRLRM